MIFRGHPENFFFKTPDFVLYQNKSATILQISVNYWISLLVKTTILLKNPWFDSTGHQKIRILAWETATLAIFLTYLIIVLVFKQFVYF